MMETATNSSRQSDSCQTVSDDQSKSESKAQRKFVGKACDVVGLTTEERDPALCAADFVLFLCSQLQGKGAVSASAERSARDLAFISASASSMHHDLSLDLCSSIVLIRSAHAQHSLEPSDGELVTVSRERIHCEQADI